MKLPQLPAALRDPATLSSSSLSQSSSATLCSAAPFFPEKCPTLLETRSVALRAEALQRCAKRTQRHAEIIMGFAIIKRKLHPRGSDVKINAFFFSLAKEKKKCITRQPIDGIKQAEGTGSKERTLSRITPVKVTFSRDTRERHQGDKWTSEPPQGNRRAVVREIRLCCATIVTQVHSVCGSF